MSSGLRGIWKAYAAREVLRGMDLDVSPGEIYGLLGPNGSGKSTALRVLSGVLPPDRGRVLGDSPPTSGARRTHLGFVPQESALYPNLSCYETLCFFGGVHGVPRRELRARVETVIDAIGLEPYRRVPTRALSGGWRQLLSVAAALVHEPRLLVLDEPTTGLDVKARQSAWDVIHSVAAQGTAVVLASHSLEETERHCDRVGILDRGRIASEGTPAELRRTIAAIEIAEIDVEDETALAAKCTSQGWGLRRRGERWLVWLATRSTIAQLARELDELGLRSLSLRPVTLEDVFVEVTSGSGGSE